MNTHHLGPTISSINTLYICRYETLLILWWILGDLINKLWFLSLLSLRTVISLKLTEMSLRNCSRGPVSDYKDYIPSLFESEISFLRHDFLFHTLFLKIRGPFRPTHFSDMHFKKGWPKMYIPHVLLYLF